MDGSRSLATRRGRVPASWIARGLAVATLSASQFIAIAQPAYADPIFGPPGVTIAPPPDQGSGLGTLHAVVPARVRDTRDGTGGPVGPIGAGQAMVVDVTGVGGVPTSGVAAVAANVTVTEPSRPGYLTLYPSGVARPLASNLNFIAGQTVPNLVVVQVGSDGNIVVFNGSGGSVQLVVDVTGWFKTWTVETTVTGSSDLLLHSVVPIRVRDTRDGTGGSIGALGAGQTAVVDVTGVGPVPATGVAAIAANVTATEPTRPGYLTLYPSGVSRPLASNLNFLAGQTVPNLVMVQVGSDGNILVFNGSGGSVHFIVDVTGWYGPGDPSTGALLRPMVPARVRDTRDGTGGSIGAIGSDQSGIVDVTGVGGLPATGVAAVVANVTATEPTRPGYLTLYPSGVSRPLASNVNFLAGQTVPNLVVVKAGSDGNIIVFNGSAGSVHVIVDVAAYFIAASAVAYPGSVLPAGVRPPGRASTPTPFKPTKATPAKLVLPWQPGVPQFASQRPLTGTASPSSAMATNILNFPIGEAGYFQQPPDKATGRLYAYSDATTRHSVCSGTVVARNLVLTAAHCIVDPGTGVPAYGWGFVPQQFGTAAPYGLWFASAYWVPTQYNPGPSLNQGADFGLLLFDNPDANGKLIGDVVGTFKPHADPHGGLKYSIGYPLEGWFNTNCTFDFSVCWPYYCASTLDSQDQFAQEAIDSTVQYGAWYSQGFGCYMTGGASGGGVFQQIGSEWFVVGVNSHLDLGSHSGDGTLTYSENCTRPSGVCFRWAMNMWSPYFNQVIIDEWNYLKK